MSHKNADVERGFSINSDLIVENLGKESVVKDLFNYKVDTKMIILAIQNYE